MSEQYTLCPTKLAAVNFAELLADIRRWQILIDTSEELMSPLQSIIPSNLNQEEKKKFQKYFIGGWGGLIILVSTLFFFIGIMSFI